MPHTYSKNKRVKRPDFRPNGKVRRKADQAKAAATPVEELISTRIHTSLRKERPVTGQLRKEKADPTTIRTRALQKLLRQIASLAEKHQAGATLNDSQKEKLGRFDEVVAELEELLGSESEDDDIEESEEETPVGAKADEDKEDQSKESKRTEPVEVKAKKQKLTHQDQQGKSKKSKQTAGTPKGR